MTKGTLIFRIIISVLLVLTMLISAFFATLFIFYIDRNVVGESYGFYVAGVKVSKDNDDDILGDGTVYYNRSANVLTFENAEIECDCSVISSKIDLMINLIGENKFVVSGEQVSAVYVSDNMLSKDLAFIGDGSLVVEFKGSSFSTSGIHARNLRIEADIDITMPDCENIVNGIYCDGWMTISNGATVTLNNGTGKYTTAVKVRDNLDVEQNSTLNVSSRPGTTEMCRGLNIGGTLTIWEGAALNVAVDDTMAKTSVCIKVPGHLSVGPDATLTASSKKACSIECFGSMELNSGASVSVSREGEGVDLMCYGAIVNYGATVNGEVEALGGIHNK